MRDRVRYLSNGETVEVAGFAPDAMLLDHLRLARGLTGTKEGCNEGDCGACTVAVGRLVNGVVRYEPVNACIQLVGQADGAEVVTIEDLARREGRLHPIQDAMVRHHGSQCGFCTPGIVMSLFTLYQDEGPVGRSDVLDRLAGNLCRCTGYRPIVDAALEACGSREGGRSTDAFARAAADTAAKLSELAAGEDLFVGTDQSFFAAPSSVAALADLYARHPDATILAGATDVGLWITKQLRRLPKIISVGRVAELRTIRREGGGLVLGAAVTYAEAEAAVAAIDPDLGELWRRIGSKQVRASGTVGGNVANGSPIGDTPPALIALGASVELRRGAETRILPLEDFFIAYGKQDRQPGEFVAALHVPALAPDQRFRAMKLSKRFDQDISAVMAAFRLTLDGRTVTAARLAYGGMAGTPKRASLAEVAIVGASLDDPSSWTPALDALGSDFVPLTDMRASADYRRTTAIRLFEKALIEIAGAGSSTTRVVGIREGVHERVA